jgi:Electron transfer DM13
VVAPLVALGVLVGLLGGLWIAAGVLAPTYLTSIVFGIAWFLIASVLLGRAVKRRPDLKWWVRGTFLATAAACAAAFAWTSLRDKTVNERVPVGVPASKVTKGRAAKPQNVALAAGPFKVADEGSARGTATVVRRASGDRVLTLTHFAVNNGPDLRVYLVAGDGRDVGKRIDLGGLKGNKGNQKYDVPRSADLGRYRTVVIWCRAFTVAFARAQLRPA